jgi:hypothetical protein
MSGTANDDLEAVRIVVETLKKLTPEEQVRVIRWSQEKLGLSSTLHTAVATAGTTAAAAAAIAESKPAGGNIRSFVESKHPSSDVQFAAAVAYYYAFEAPKDQRKSEISAKDLQDATRLADTDRLARPITTLHNAVQRGYLDKGSGRGTFKINTVGENLVAMSLPTTASTTTSSAGKTRTAHSKKKKKGKKK